MTTDMKAMDKTITTDAHQYINRGDRLLQRQMSPQCSENLLDEALNAYTQAMENMPESALLSSRISKVYFLKGQYTQAQRAAERALSLASRSMDSSREKHQAQSDAYYVCGMILSRRNEHRAAEKALSIALQTSGLSSSRVWFARFQNERDQAMTSPWSLTGLFSGVKALFSLIGSILLLPFESDRPAIRDLLLLVPRLLIAWMLEEMHRDEEALNRYLSLASDYPGLASVSLVIGDMCREKGDISQSRVWFESVIRRHPANLDAHYHLAQLLEQEEAYQEMANVYHSLNRLKPNDPHIYCNIANAYYYLQDYRTALTYYEMALQLGHDPEWKAMVAQSIGNLHFDYSHNTQAALAYYQLARSLDPSNVETHVQMGMIYFQSEDYTNAELIYRKAIQIAPENPKLFSNLGYLRWLAGDIHGAVGFYEKAISLDCGYEIPINNLGVIHLDMLGNVHRAIELFKQALELDEHYALAYYNLGRAYSFLDNRTEAAHCFHMAQELNQFSRDLDNEELAARIQQLFDTCELELLE